MKNLKVLLLDHCKWLQADVLTSICKFQNLEILSLYMCKKLSEDEIATISIAGRFGFNNLKVVDMRFAGFGDLFLKTLYTKPKLQIMYCQCYGTTYAKERHQRKLDIINGINVREHSHISDDEDCEDLCEESMRKRFRANEFQKYNTVTITDETVLIFTRLLKTDQQFVRPESVLYQYPYTKCTCNQFPIPSPIPSEKIHFPSTATNVDWDQNSIKEKLQKEIKKQKENFGKGRGGSISFICPNISVICKNLVYDSCMNPEWYFAEATSKFVWKKWMCAREPRNDFEITMIEHTDKHLDTRIIRDCSVYKHCQCPKGASNVLIPQMGGPQYGFVQSYLSKDQVSTKVNTKHKMLLKTIARYIIMVKMSTDKKTKARSAAFRIIREIVKFANLSNFNLKNDKYIMRIAELIYELAMTISYDVYQLLSSHASCFDDLFKQLHLYDRQEDLLRLFFQNLVRKESCGKDPSLVLPGPSRLEERDDEVVHPADIPTITDVNNLPARHVIIHRLPNPSECGNVPPISFRVFLRDREPAKFPTSIRELSFRGFSHITDFTLTCLRNLDLDLLDVTDTKVTVAGIENFMRSNPNCRLIHESTCRCRPTLHF
ncbi:hypothetical protein FQA39_LY14285 [Lamprigera yunnana]|nr:hypothetical protein FQA39_LY14285 [Lamprigera yunnana]